MMGCYGSVEQQLNSSINRALSISLAQATDIKKLILLGAGGSGKSTFFKQLRQIHGTGYADMDRRQFKKHLSHQIIQELKQMICCAEELIEEDHEQYAQYKLSDDVLEYCVQFKKLPDDTDISRDINDIITFIWSDHGIRNIYADRARFAITESTGFFLDNIERITQADYIPTYEDVLLIRTRSLGITDKLFTIQSTLFRVFDVGGQRAERRKWIHCFEHVTAVIYVASLNGYNEVMYEDESKNVMQDDLLLFEKTCNNEWFRNTSVILFLNKRDLFEDKIKSVAITCCFPDYEGPHTHDASMNEIKLRYKARNYDQQIYIHVTCAVDKENVRSVFNDVQHVLVSSNLDKFV